MPWFIGKFNMFWSGCSKQMQKAFKGCSFRKIFEAGIFYSLKEAKVVIENWRQEYNTIRPHSSLGYKPSAPAAKLLLVGFEGKARQDPQKEGLLT